MGRLKKEIQATLKENKDLREEWIEAYNKLTRIIWVKFYKSSTKYRKLTTEEMLTMYDAINNGKELEEAYEEAIQNN
ncbi:hypothetical protein [Paenibacillus elgii]|uniref:hypothetical protein n=1 Tax=Paenibacillus elgii TaxID=189691 RepID=UPI000248C6C0|nr:hypothetical protein [Paenibacillus elgii]